MHMELISIFDRPVAQLPALTTLFHELTEPYQVLKQKDRPTAERLQAFERICESEVGNTPLLRARNLERELGIRQLWLKFEGSNPTGTQKDRIAFALTADALRLQYQGITLATCGNYGVACALAAKVAGVSAKIFIPEDYHTKRVGEMENLGATVLRVPGDYETVVGRSQQFALAHSGIWYDANPGGAHAALQVEAYSQIADEIHRALPVPADVVASPVSNGTVLLGIGRGYERLRVAGQVHQVPRLAGGSAFGKNPIVASFLRGKTQYEDLPPERIHETATNEPLINWHSFDGPETLDAIRTANGWATNVSDKTMQRLSRLLRDLEGLHVLPAATAGLAALLDRKSELRLGVHVVVLTSRK